MANEQDDPLAALRAPLLYRAPGMERVTARRFTYRQTPDGDLPLNVYAPPNLSAGERRPAVVFIHGGPISPELPPATEWGIYRGYGALAAASGWVGVTFTHRFYSWDALEQAEGDIAAVIAYTREHAGELNVDAERLCLWAFSGGGPFLASALRERPAYVRCLVAYYTLLDVRPMASPEERTDDAAMARITRFSPAAAINPESPAILVARAGQDHPGLNATIDGFIQAALSANVLLDALNHAHGQHSFDTRDDVPRTREIVHHTLAFVRERFEA